MWIGGIHAAGSVGGAPRAIPCPAFRHHDPERGEHPRGDCRIGAYCGNTRLATDSAPGHARVGRGFGEAASKPANEVHDFLLVISDTEISEDPRHIRDVSEGAALKPLFSTLPGPQL